MIVDNNTQPAVCHALASLPAMLERLSARHIFVVIDPAVQSMSAVADVVRDERWQWRVFNEVKSNPDVRQITAAMNCLGTMSPDVWLAIGGGTTIDLTKLVSATAARPGAMLDMLVGRTPATRHPGQLIAAPTTAGTGSEATQFAVVYVDGVKHSVESPTLLPNTAVLDPGLTASLPAAVAAHTGLDALCQAIESLWSVRSTGPSRVAAERALDLAWRSLPRVVRQPDASTRGDMLTAAHLAGRAINISKTTAAHAMSYALTIGHGVPHGAAVAMNIASLLRFNAAVSEDDCADPRGVSHVRAAIERIRQILGCDSADHAADALAALITSLGCPARLSDVGVTREPQIDSLVEQVNTQRLGNNPRRMTKAQLRTLWEQIR